MAKKRSAADWADYLALYQRAGGSQTPDPGQGLPQAPRLLLGESGSFHLTVSSQEKQMSPPLSSGSSSLPGIPGSGGGATVSPMRNCGPIWSRWERRSTTNGCIGSGARPVCAFLFATPAQRESESI